MPERNTEPRASREPNIRSIAKPDDAADLGTIPDAEPGTNRPTEPKSSSLPDTDSNPEAVDVAHAHALICADSIPGTPTNRGTDWWPDHATNIASDAS